MVEVIIMPGEIEITVGDVNDVEARVYALYRPDLKDEASETAPVLISGSLRGPYCETAHTLPAEIRFRHSATGASPTAEALVPDPCVWSPELPHLYHADIEARQGDRVLAEYRGTIGFRKANT
jgi:hypothetical protein